MQNSRSGKIYRNGEVGRIILPHLSRILFKYDSMCLEHGEQNSFRHELASTLLAASRFSEAKYKVEAISRTKNLIENDRGSYLNRMTCVQRQLSYENVRNVARIGVCLAEVMRDVATSSTELGSYWEIQCSAWGPNHFFLRKFDSPRRAYRGESGINRVDAAR